METYIYSNAITIMGVSGSQLAGAVDLPPKDAKRFISTVRGALKRLDGLRTGRRLINEINNSGNNLRIFVASNGDGAVLSNPPTAENSVRRMVKSFRPQYLNMIPQIGIAQTPLKRQEMLGKLKEKLKASNQHTGHVGSIPELDNILIKAWGTQEAGRKSLAFMLNRPRTQIDDMCDGMARISDDDYFRICFMYYQHLTPGPGTNAQMKVKATVRLEGNDGVYKPKQDIGVAPEIILGHEMVHAWRMMTGRRIVDTGWEEEAMTVGLPPFAHLKFTENQLRKEGGYGARQSYLHGTYSTSMRTDLTF